jgi:hypothetical protein
MKKQWHRIFSLTRATGQNQTANFPEYSGLCLYALYLWGTGGLNERRLHCESGRVLPGGIAASQTVSAQHASV